jgi:hypothetical protein
MSESLTIFGEDRPAITATDWGETTPSYVGGCSLLTIVITPSCQRWAASIYSGPVSWSVGSGVDTSEASPADCEEFETKELARDWAEEMTRALLRDALAECK